MAQFVEVPPARLETGVLNGLLEEFASRDGTDYGEREATLEGKVGSLLAQINRGDLSILYDADSEAWDLVPRDRAEELLHS